jgi:tripartite-type tricarboxylate transporter receptor subunit TctC
MRALARITIACLLLATGSAAQAQSEAYPARPVRIITHSAPGGAPDVQLRIVADRLSQLWGQQIIVLNQPGAGGAVAARMAAGAAPDGYTLYMPAASAFVTLPGLQPNLPLQVPRDFTAIAMIGEQPMFITVAPSLGVTTLPELIALAKKRPGEISFAATGRGTMTHLTGELLQERAGIKLLLVPYTGGVPQALNDVMGGRVAMVIDGLAALAGPIDGKIVKPLAVGSPKRLSNFPDVPAAAETLPGFNARGWAAIVAPTGTPDAIVRRVSDDLRKVMADPSVTERFATLGTYASPMTPAETTAFIQGEQGMWKTVLEQIAAQSPK